MLELAPLFWTRTLGPLDRVALQSDLGPVAVPRESLDTAMAAQQALAG